MTSRESYLFNVKYVHEYRVAQIQGNTLNLQNLFSE